MADTKRCPVTGKSDDWPYMWRCTQMGEIDISKAAAIALGINDWYKGDTALTIKICVSHFRDAKSAGLIDMEGNLFQ